MIVTSSDQQSTISGTLKACHAEEALVDDLLTPSEREIKERVRWIVDTEVRPRASAIDASGDFAEESFNALASAGLVGAMFPREFGGLAESTVTYAVLVEEITRGCASTSLIFVTQTHAAYPIQLAGSKRVQAEYLPGLLSGKLLGSLAITEPSAGSDAAALKTRARPGPDGYVLDGSKTFITSGDRSDVIVCFATLDPTRGREAISAFLIEGESPGLHRGKVLQKLGMHGSSTSELFLTEVFVPVDALLGGEGGAWSLSMRTVVKSRISAAAQGLGLAVAAYEIALNWCEERGFLTGSRNQEIQFDLADLRSRILSARLLLHSVSRAIDQGQRDMTTEVAMAKLTCTDLGFLAANQTVRWLGVEGDLVGRVAERILRDVAVTRIYDGTNEIQKLLIARDTLNRAKDAVQ